jgi:hypothetical protein
MAMTTAGRAKRIAASAACTNRWPLPELQPLSASWSGYHRASRVGPTRTETAMPTTNSNARPRRIGIATAAMGALAGGAVWCLLALYSRGDLAWFAFVVAAVVVWALRAHGYAGRWSGVAIAVGCVALACVYSLYLQAVARMASMFGMPMRTVLVRMDPSMALDLARTDLDTVGVVVLASAVLLAGVLMLRRRA